MKFYQTTHAFFLSAQSIYIVVWKLNAEAENSRVPYWLDTIKFYAPNSPILLVGTHLDTLKKKKDKLQQIKEDILEKYKSIYPNIVDVFGVSVTTGEGIKSFMGALDLSIRTHSFPKQKVPDSYFLFEQELRKMRGANSESPPVMEWENVKKIAAKCNISDDVNNVVKYFETAGTLVYFHGSETKQVTKRDWKPEEDPGFVILEPQWITQLFCTIVNQNENIQNGILSRHLLEKEIWTPPLVPPEIHPLLIRVLSAYGIIFQFPSQDAILIPGLLGDKLDNLQAMWPAHSPLTVQFTRYYDFSFIPSSLFPRLIVHILQLQYSTKCWKTGIIIEDEEAFCLVQYCTSINRISVAARGKEADHNPAVLFSTIVEFLDALLEHHFEITNHKIFLPCPLCESENLTNPTLFKKSECEDSVANKKSVLECNKIPSEPHRVPLLRMAPDIAMIDFQSLRINIEQHIEIGQKVGEGAFAHVYKGLFNDQVIAVKYIKPAKGKLLNKILNEFRREVRVMSRFQHSCLVELIGYSMNPPALVLEYLKFGDLYTYIHTDNVPLDWPLKFRIACDIATGMAFLHCLNPPLIHRDLKTPNVMLSSNNPTDQHVAKVCDFGLSKELLTDSFRPERSSKRDVVNPTWLSPEVIQELPNDLPADVYPFGIIMWELLTRQLPFAEYSFASDQEAAILEGKRPEIPSVCLVSYSSLMQRCWAGNPKDRPTYPAIIKLLMPIIRDFDRKLADSISQISKRYKENKSVRKSNSTIVLPNNTPPSPSPRREEKTSLTPKEITDLGFVPWTSTSLANRWKLQIKSDIPAIQKITNEIYICPFPGEPELLDTINEELVKYEGKYRLFNMSGMKYNYAIFSGTVVEHHLDVENLPKFKDLVSCVEDINAWISSSNDRVAILHGSDEQSAHGVLLASALIQKRNPSFDPEKIISHIQSITQFRLSPSLRRYFQYYHMHEKYQISPSTLYLHKMKFTAIPNFKFTGGCDPIYSIQQNGKTIYFSKKLKGKKDKNSVEFFCRDVSVSGDIRIEFYHKSCSHKMFGLSINTDYESAQSDCKKLTYSVTDLDKAFKDTSKKHFPNGFQLELYFLKPEQHNQIYNNLSTNLRTQPTVRTLHKNTSTSPSFFSKPLEKEEADPSGLNCYICKKSIKLHQTTISLNPGINVHYGCLECSVCGVSLKENTLETVVKLDKIICKNCDKDIFASCVSCKKKIITKAISYGIYNWHPVCFKCSTCQRTINNDGYTFENGKPTCSNCCEIETSATFSLEEEELEQILNDNIGRKHFAAFLESRKAHPLYSFWDDIINRKDCPRFTRKNMAASMESLYLNLGSEKCIPPLLVKKILPLAEDKTKLELFDNAQSLLLQHMAKNHFVYYMASPHFDAYLSDLVADQDPEVEEENLRRNAVKAYIPVNPEDSPQSQNVKTQSKLRDSSGQAEENFDEELMMAAQKATERARQIALMVDKQREKAEIDRKQMEHQLSNALSSLVHTPRGKRIEREETHSKRRNSISSSSPSEIEGKPENESDRSTPLEDVLLEKAISCFRETQSLTAEVKLSHEKVKKIDAIMKSASHPVDVIAKVLNKLKQEYDLSCQKAGKCRTSFLIARKASITAKQNKPDTQKTKYTIQICHKAGEETKIAFELLQDISNCLETCQNIYHKLLENTPEESQPQTPTFKLSLPPSVKQKIERPKSDVLSVSAGNSPTNRKLLTNETKKTFVVTKSPISKKDT